jgi:nitroimidazol reductase NimA-like FMN-containing flavoprotein (pyridoxamine 5'-phosphate oxidase superfamily)
MFGTLNDTQIEDLLKRQLLGRLGCHVNGLTYVVPLSYAYKDGYLYCHTQEGLKISMLRKNKQLCFQVDDAKDLSNWQSVICWGEFEELTEEDAKREALTLLNKRNFPVATTQKMRINQEWPFRDNTTEKLKGIFFRIKIEDRTGRYEKADESIHFAS